MPPPGGFEPVKYKRNLPTRGPSAALFLTAVLGMCTWGFYRMGQGNLERRCVSTFQTFLLLLNVRAFGRELQREKVWSRIHLVPLLLAEGDRDTYRRQQAALAREKEIMKDVPGWQVRLSQCPCFHLSTHWIQPGFLFRFAFCSQESRYITTQNSRKYLSSFCRQAIRTTNKAISLRLYYRYSRPHPWIFALNRFTENYHRPNSDFCSFNRSNC